MADSMLRKLFMQTGSGRLQLPEIVQHHMSSQRIFRGADRPDVKMMNGFDFRIFQQMLPNVVHIDPNRHPIHRQPHTLLEQPPGGEEDHHGNHQPDQRIDDIPPGPENQRAGEDHPHRNQRIGQHVQISTFNVEIMLLLPDEEERGQAVDDHTDSSGDDDRPSSDLRRRKKLPDALRHNCADRNQENRGIQQRSPDRALPEPIGVILAVTLPGQQKCRQRDQQAAHVSQVVARISKQPHRLEQEARGELPDDEQGVQYNSKQKCTPLDRIGGEFVMMMVVMMFVFMIRHDDFPLQNRQTSPSSGTRSRVS